MRQLRSLATAIALATLFTLPALASPQAQSEGDFLDQLAAQAVPEPQTAAASNDRGNVTEAVCSATANCLGAGSASCSTNVSGATCQAVDRNCSAGQQGYARCGSTTVYCNACLVMLQCIENAVCTSTKQCGGTLLGLCSNGRCVCR